MMNRLDGERMFLAVMETGSFVAAAARLGTSSGQAYFERLRLLLDEFDNLDRSIRNISQAPGGRLRVTAPLTFGTLELAPPLTRFDVHGLGSDEQASVVARVLTVMMTLPENLRQPYLIVIDEVQRFVPQHGNGKAKGAIIKAAKEGRKLGITLLVATQRIADVSKALTSQTKNRLYGHFEDLADRDRIAKEVWLSPRQSKGLAELDKGEFLIRGKTFGGPLDKVRIRKPLTGKLGKDHMIEKLRLPISPIDEVHALFGARAAEAGKPAGAASASPPVAMETWPTAAGMVVPLSFEPDEISMEALLLEILAPLGRRGLHKDSLALLAGTTERRGAFQDAISSLLAGTLVSIGTSTKVRIMPNGSAAAEGGGAARTVFERLAALRGKREANDERVVACLSAAGHVQLELAEIRARTGLGPRVLKAALQRLKRDAWIIERRGGFATSPALARLIGR